MLGIKHLIDCHCYLKIFKTEEKIIYHKFIVYSQIDENGNILEKYVKCNNCNAVHKVFEINRSEIFAGKDQTDSITTIEDLKYSLPKVIVNIFEQYKNDIADYEHAIDIYAKKAWGSEIILKRDIIDEMYQIKYLVINSKESFEIKNETINDTIIL